jgi:hypothetical protein
MKQRLLIRLFCAITLVINGFVILPFSPSSFHSTVLASSLTVTNTNDSGIGSLRQAVIDANPGDTISFNLAFPATIQLLNGAISVQKSLTIAGPGADLLTVSGGETAEGQLDGRVFEIGGASNVTISGLKIANGKARSGGGILNSSSGALTFSNCTISGNLATDSLQGTGATGGGIFSSGGLLNLTSCTISGNSASSAMASASGGGILNAGGPLTIAGTTISGNAVNGALVSSGGGVSTGPGTSVIDSTISGNTSSGSSAGAAGLDSSGSARIISSRISGNTATVPFGDESANSGGISSHLGPMTITNSTISGNSAASHGASEVLNGGGILNDGTLTITGSTVSGNTATGSTEGGNGGGINSVRGTLTITNCTVSGNNATVTDQTTGSNCGGILNGGALTITNSTVVRNTTTGTTEDGVSGGGILVGILFFGTAPSANVKNTIIALNSAGGAASLRPDVSGSFTSQGHNLIGQADGGTGFSQAGDQTGSIASPLDPKLGPLQNNGGTTLTISPLAGSPAIDAGDDSVLGPPLFLTTDQRGPGFPRKSGQHVDIGAFEVQAACLTDSSTGNLFQFDSTGEYKLLRCADGFTLTGTGTFSLTNSIMTLTDSKADRKVSAGFNQGQRTGTATIYLKVGPGIWQTFRVNSTNPAAVCSCAT